MSTSTGYDNAFMGFEAGRGNTEGIGNTALGCEAMIYAWQVRSSLRAACVAEAEALTVGGYVS